MKIKSPVNRMIIWTVVTCYVPALYIWLLLLVVPVQVVTENCWISNSSKPREGSRVILLRNTCPVDLSVEIQTQIDTTNNSQSHRVSHGSFSFQVNKEYGGLVQFFVHCRLGLCTSDPAHVRGNLIMVSKLVTIVSSVLRV